MSNSIYPRLAGETWPVVKKPLFNTSRMTTASGREVRIANYQFPFFEVEIPYSWVSSVQAIATMQQLYGFYCQMNGAFDTFLWQDDSDKQVTGQPIGTGNGSKTTFQMQRTLGSSTAPVYSVNGVVATLGSPVTKIYLGGVQQMSGWTISNSGLLTFTSPPGAGVAITADFSYFWRMTFAEDNLEFEEFAQDYWEVKKVTLRYVLA